LFFALVIVSTFILSFVSNIIFFDLPTSAEDRSPEKDAIRLNSAGWLADCLFNELDKKGNVEFVREDVDKYTALTGDNRIIGQAIDKTDGKMDCSSASSLKSRILALGYEDFASLLLDKNVGNCTLSDVSSGSNLKDIKCTKSGWGGNVNSLMNKLLGGQPNSLENDTKYYLSYATFLKGCEGKKVSAKEAAATDKDHIFEITELDSEANVVKNMYRTPEGKGQGRDVSTIPPNTVGKMWVGSTYGNFTCAHLANMTGKYIAAFQTWASSHLEEWKNLQENIVKEPGNSDEKTSCAIDGIGWIVCPVINFLAKISDAAFKYIADSFLEIKAEIFDTSAANGVYDGWVVMRNIANVAFIIAFLIIIFSHLTSFGITNYGLKKMLPRLIVAAILVNLSYFVCQIAVDLSNILGYSLQALLAGLVHDNLGAADFNLEGVATGVLAGGAALTMLYFSLAALIPLLIAAVVACIMIAFLLVARQAIIILLVVISPIAFVCYLLPNTEGLYKKWQKMFVGLLMLFPIVGLVFGASTLASTILKNTFSVEGADQETLSQIVAAAVRVLPLFIVPVLLKKSLDGVGNIGARINGLGERMGKGLSNPARKWSEEALERRKNRLDSTALNNDGRWHSLRRRRLHGQANRNARDQFRQGEVNRATTEYVTGQIGENDSNLLRQMTASGGAGAGARAQSSAMAAREKLDQEEMAAHMTMIAARGDAPTGNGGLGEQFVQAILDGDRNLARSLQQVLATQMGDPGRDELQMRYHGLEAGGLDINDANDPIGSSLKTDLNKNNLVGSNAALAQYGFSERPMDAIEADPTTWTSLTTTQLAGQSMQNLRAAPIGPGGITREIAQAVLTNPSAAADLTPEKRALLDGIT
jgi:hypothetical protein